MKKFIIAFIPIYLLFIVIIWADSGSLVSALLCVFISSCFAALIALWMYFVSNHFDY